MHCFAFTIQCAPTQCSVIVTMNIWSVIFFFGWITQNQMLLLVLALQKVLFHHDEKPHSETLRRTLTLSTPSLACIRFCS